MEAQRIAIRRRRKFLVAEFFPIGGCNLFTTVYPRWVNSTIEYLAFGLAVPDVPSRLN